MSAQEANCTGHRANKVLFLGDLNKLLSTGTSRWNNRQLAVWDQVSLPCHPTLPLTITQKLSAHSFIPLLSAQAFIHSFIHSLTHYLAWPAWR